MTSLRRDHRRDADVFPPRLDRIRGLDSLSIYQGSNGRWHASILFERNWAVLPGWSYRRDDRERPWYEFSSYAMGAAPDWQQRAAVVDRAAEFLTAVEARDSIGGLRRLLNSLATPNPAVRAETPLQAVCPDEGTCHHDCPTVLLCFRVELCEPLSGVYPDDEWPRSVLLAHVPRMTL